MWPVVVEGAFHRIFNNTADVVFLIGAIAGLLAWGHGGAATGRFVGQFAVLGKKLEETENPSAEQIAEYEAAKKKMFVHTNISAWITLVAVLGMSLARYMPQLW
jgi:hypothetical protein